MRSVSAALCFCLLTAPALTGCGQNSWNLARSDPGLLSPNGQTAVQQNELLRNRANALDRDNQQLESLLAQSRQQIQLLRDQLTAVRDELKSSTSQLAAMRDEQRELQDKTEALTASVRRQRGATIKPNNSRLGQLSVIHVPGVDVRQDGDVIRVELPADRLFHSGGKYFRSGATDLIDTVAADLARNYPEQIIGVEAHTDVTPIRNNQFPSNHHLSMSWAMAVYDHLTQVARLPQDQLFVTGHGANHPVVSNATQAGQTRNRRVELVIYPEKYLAR